MTAGVPSQSSPMMYEDLGASLPVTGCGTE